MGRWMWSNIEHDEVSVDEWDVFDESEIHGCDCGECFICEYKEGIR